MKMNALYMLKTLIIVLVLSIGSEALGQVTLSFGKTIEQPQLTGYKPGSLKIKHSKGELNLKIDSLVEEDLRQLGLWVPDKKFGSQELDRAAQMAGEFRPLPAKAAAQTPVEYERRVVKHIKWCGRTIGLFRKDLELAEKNKDAAAADALRIVLIYAEWCLQANNKDLKAL